MNKTKAFTLAEVVLSLGITAILFLGVTRVLIASLSYSKNIIGVIRFQQEQQRLHLAISNAFAESETVVYPTPSANPVAADKIILRNKPTSSLFPFTIIEPTGDNRLIIRDFTLNPTLNPAPSTSRTDKDVTAAGHTFTLDTATNRIRIGSGASGQCSGSVTTDCVVFGYKNNLLAYNATGYAPFLGAPFLSDIRADTNDIYVLSPYEKREYKIHVAAGHSFLHTTFTTPTGAFPYFYNGTTPITPTLNSSTTFIPPTPPSRPYNITELTYNATNPTQAPPSSLVELRVIQFKVTDAANANLTATVTVPAMVKK